MPPVKGQRQARGLARQREIIDTAFEFFATRGYKATTTAMVAEAVGITEPGVLHHFPSKEALLVAVLEARDNPAPDIEAEALTAGGALTSLRQLPAFARVLVDNPLLARFDVVLGGESVTDRGIGVAHFANRRALIRDRLRGVLEQGITEGDLRPDLDTAATATQIVAFMDGIQFQWLLDPDSTDLVGAYAAFVENLVAAISPGGA